MMKKIFVHRGLTERFDAALDFYEIPYTKVDIWNHDRHYPDTDLLPAQTGIFLVLDWRAVYEALLTEDATKKLVAFCQRGNHLCMFNDRDGNGFFEFVTIDTMRSFDDMIPKGSASLILDCQVIDTGVFHNITIGSIPSWNLKDQLRISYKKIAKCRTSHDFLLLMKKKRGRPHREVLWNQLESKGLPAQGLCNFVPYDANQTGLLMADDDSIPFQLYGNCWFEIVPETTYQNLWYMTEKTIKPMLCRTPFLILTAPGYLAWLRSQGFQTFEYIINESYDTIEDLESRVEALTDQVHRIIHDIGSENFYKESQAVCEHNFHWVNSKIGSWYSDSDRVIYEMVQEFVQ